LKLNLSIYAQKVGAVLKKGSSFEENNSRDLTPITVRINAPNIAAENVRVSPNQDTLGNLYLFDEVKITTDLANLNSGSFTISSRESLDKLEVDDILYLTATHEDNDLWEFYILASVVSIEN
jgi:hypothetical protein